MEYANDEIFSIRYNKYTDVLETKNLGKKKFKILKKNNFIKTVVIAAIICIIVNIILIMNFILLFKNL